jgi:hypothetical protein
LRITFDYPAGQIEASFREAIRTAREQKSTSLFAHIL